jgi:threonine dehydrogenase-like Zn-dependent dehydrogenase
VPEKELIELPAVDPRQATLFPLVETALQITLDAGAVAFTELVVSGLGVVGILTGALLLRAGASVIGLDPEPARRDAAAHFGIESYAPEEAPDVVRRATSGGVSLGVEASGNPEALRGLLDLLAHEGTVLVASWYGSRPVELPLGGTFHRRRITIRSTQVSTLSAIQSSSWTINRRREVAAALLSELDLGRLATHQFPLSAAPEAFASVDKGEPGLIHAALSYEEET